MNCCIVLFIFRYVIVDERQNASSDFRRKREVRSKLKFETTALYKCLTGEREFYLLDLALRQCLKTQAGVRGPLGKPFPWRGGTRGCGKRRPKTVAARDC